MQLQNCHEVVIAGASRRSNLATEVIITPLIFYNNTVEIFILILFRKSEL